MIKRLQRKFVVIAALCLLIVELAIVGGINGVNIYQTNKNADELLNMIIDNDGRFPEFDPMGIKHDKPQNDSDSPSGSNVQPENRKPDRHKGFNEETKYQTRYFVVYADESGEITKVDTGHVAAVTSSQAIEYGEEVLKGGKSSGTSGNYRYKTGDTDKGKMIVFMDCRSDAATKNRFLLVSCAIGAAGYILVCLLIIIFSKRAIRPVVESFEKQKQFITDAGHEIKTPLAIISANTEVLEMVSEPNEWTASIKNQITRLNGLLKELLSLAKMEEEKPALTMSDFNISDAVYDAASPFATLAETKGKKLTIDVANGLTYHGDEGAIRQLVSILTENAVKYADEGGEIAVKLFTSHNGKETDLEVSNTCKEPPQGDLSKLFDRFYRDDSSRSRSKGEKKGGYGIGLSIAQAIVRSHKSKISCKAENGMMIFTAQLK
ncbi:HAMP domain-containing sensor histidine kinase [uncultured Ruminococcus sp.]|uniref:sensor histidine kinase n=1 Tax=uncultured Ruminococcus sp. TaxID=165186 RepID=UPI002666AFDE|nr:HAMP domain-containing sensor histidine kinase [uncultured Ruminococcus sp.]